MELSPPPPPSQPSIGNTSNPKATELYLTPVVPLRADLSPSTAAR
jgi:hypothetical protein